MSTRSPRPVRAYLALGANLGDRETSLRQALSALDDTEGLRVLRTSSVYETEPQGVPEQPWFLNLVAEVETTLSPRQLLARTQEIEAELGRHREIRWGPLRIDLDILLYAEETVVSPSLEIPHPRMLERAFVMVPLAELAPRRKLRGETTRAHARRLAKEQAVRAKLPL